MTVLSSLLIAVGVDPAGVDKGIGQADTRIGGFANKMNKVGGGLTKGVTLPILALGGFALKSAMDVDEAYDTIQAGTGATGKKLKGLQDVFSSVAKRTPADLNAVATTVTDLNRRLDLTGPTLGKLSRQILEAGRMSGVEVNVRSATSAFSAFGLEGKATTGGMDDLFRVSQATGLGINDLTSILAKSGGVLSQLGFSFTESAATIGVLDKAGVNSRAVISSMSAGLVKLAKDGESPATAFKRVGGELQGLVDKGEDAKALNLAAQVFGTRGAGQFVAALKSGKVNLDDMTKSAGLSGDSILGVAHKTKDFPELWQQFKNQATLALAPLAADLLPKLGDGLKSLSERLTQAVTWWDGLSASTQGYILKALAVAAAVGPILMITAKMITVFQALAPIITGLKMVWTGLNLVFAMSPIGLLVIAIVALVAGLVIAYQKSETFRDIVNGAFGAVKDFVGAALDWIVEKALAWGPYLLGALLGPVGLIVVGIIKHWDQVKAGTAAAWDWVVEKVKAIPGLLLAAFMNFTLPGLIIKHWDTIKEKTSAVWDSIVSFVKSIPGKLLSFFMNWTLAGQVIKHWDDAKDGTVRVATSIVNWVADLPGRIIGKLASLGGQLFETNAQAFGRMLEAAKNKATALLGWVGGLPGRVKSKLGDLGRLLFNAGMSIIQGLIDGVTDKAGDLMGKLQEITNKIPDWKGPASKDRNLLRGVGHMIMQGLIDAISSKDGDLKSELEKVTHLIEKTMNKRFKNDKAADIATQRVLQGLKAERAELVLNARAHDRMVEKLTKAKDKLHDLVQQARDYAQSVRDSVVSFGNITSFVDQETGKTTADQIIAGLQKKLFDAAAYSSMLQSLVAMGLNETSLDQLEQAGVEGGLATVSALVEGGQAAVDQVNQLTGQLVSVGGNLGDSLSDTMYGAGIDAAQSLVDSLESKVEALEKAGRKLARAFMKALEHELGKPIHIDIPGLSPDEVYTSAQSKTEKAVVGRASTGSTSSAKADTALLDAVERVAAGVGQVKTAVEKTPRETRRLDRKGGR